MRQRGYKQAEYDGVGYRYALKGQHKAFTEYLLDELTTIPAAIAQSQLAEIVWLIVSTAILEICSQLRLHFHAIVQEEAFYRQISPARTVERIAWTTSTATNHRMGNVMAGRTVH